MARGSSATAVELSTYFGSRRDELLSTARALVECESPTLDAAACAAAMAQVLARLERIGASARLHETRNGPHLTARAGFGGTGDRRPILLLGHVDTVWPRGTLEHRPFRVAEGCAYGPGVFDMKSGIAVMLAALEAIRDLGLEPRHPVEILLTCDEESGSGTSRALIEAEAAACAAVLVLEPPLAGGRAKTARRGVGRYDLVVRGVAAHAGLEPEKGRSAIVELAHQVLALTALNDDDGVSVNVGIVSGGTYSNVVAGEARAEIDVRFRTTAQAEAVSSRIAALAPVLDGTRLEITGAVDRPPLERTPAVVALFERARAAAAGLGFELGEGAAGGGSDGSFTAALGIPTLDGLGVDGDGAHAEHEHIVIDDLPRRAALLTTLLLGSFDGAGP
jgi:glutamate carboxypeptidase